MKKTESWENKFMDFLSTKIYVTDAKGRLSHYNSAAVELSGRRPKLGSDQWSATWKLYHPAQTPMPHKKRPIIAISWKENCSLNAAEVISEQPDGERHWFKENPSPLRFGDIIGGIYMLIDVSKQKRVD